MPPRAAKSHLSENAADTSAVDLDTDHGVFRHIREDTRRIRLPGIKVGSAAEFLEGSFGRRTEQGSYADAK